MLEMHQVTKAYRTDLLETHALREFSLKVENGEFVAVTGPSGSGKTTFLNVAGLLETFDSGSYRLDGEDVSRWPPHRRARAGLARTFQLLQVFESMSVRDNLRTAAQEHIGTIGGRLFRRPLLMAFGLSLSLSVTAEWSQVYSHTRYPSATDVTCNVAGAVLAAALSRRLDSEPRTLR